METPSKICNKCGELKPLFSFHKSKGNPDGLKYHCKECDKIYRGTHQKTAFYHQRKNRKSKFGITVEDYDRIFDKQKGCCAICRMHQTELPRALGVDHNHETGKIRGLLCSYCNRGLGYFKESRGCLIKAIQYITKYR